MAQHPVVEVHYHPVVLLRGFRPAMLREHVEMELDTFR
jgi:hypothetical protein